MSGVVAVPAVEHRPEHVHTQSARGAWLAVAVTPVVWLAIIVAGFASGEDGAGSPVLAAAWASLVSAAAPAAAVALGVRAARAGDRSGKMAAVAAAVLLMATFVFLPVLVISMGPGWVIALAVVAVALGVLEWRSRRKPSP